MPTRLLSTGTLESVLIAALLLAAAPLPAQDEASLGQPVGAPIDAQAEPLDEYRIELIVFEYGDSLAGTTEDWSGPAEETTPASEAEEDGSDPGNEAAGGVPPPTAGDTVPLLMPLELALRFRPVPEDERQLSGLLDRLRQTTGYEPLLHVAWEQPGYPPEAAQPLALSRLAELPERLRGEVKLYRSRFLHLVVDLELLSGPARAPRATFGEDAIAALEADVFRLSESRKLKSGELHYFDHPRYGILARVTPVEKEQPADAAADVMPGGS